MNDIAFFVVAIRILHIPTLYVYSKIGYLHASVAVSAGTAIYFQGIVRYA